MLSTNTMPSARYGSGATDNAQNPAPRWILRIRARRDRRCQPAASIPSATPCTLNLIATARPPRITNTTDSFSSPNHRALTGWCVPPWLVIIGCSASACLTNQPNRCGVLLEAWPCGVSPRGMPPPARTTTSSVRDSQQPGVFPPQTPWATGHSMRPQLLSHNAIQLQQHEGTSVCTCYSLS